MKKLFEDRKGEVPGVILVLGVIAICALAIFSFLVVEWEAKSGFGSLRAVDEVVISAKRIEFYQEVGVSETDLEVLFEIKSDEVGRYISSGNEIVSVKYYLP